MHYLSLLVPPTAGTEIKYVFFEDDLLVKNYSEVNIETITADGSSLAYDISTNTKCTTTVAF